MARDDQLSEQYRKLPREKAPEALSRRVLEYAAARAPAANRRSMWLPALATACVAGIAVLAVIPLLDTSERTVRLETVERQAVPARMQKSAPPAPREAPADMMPETVKRQAASVSVQESALPVPPAAAPRAASDAEKAADGALATQSSYRMRSSAVRAEPAADQTEECVQTAVELDYEAEVAAIVKLLDENRRDEAQQRFDALRCAFPERSSKTLEGLIGD